MNPAQLRMYRAEWAKVRRWYREHGLSPKAADAKRHEIHVKELGKNKSSLALTNGELTKVKRAFRAIYDGGNLNAQMRANDEPERIAQNIANLAEQCGIQGGAEGLQHYFRNWFRGRSYDKLDEHELQQLTGLLERRVAQLVPSSGDPF